MSADWLDLLKKNKKVTIGVGLVVVLLITLLSVGNTIRNEAKVNSLLNSANELITQDKFDDASLRINEALNLNPRNIKKVYVVRQKITDIKNGTALIKDAKEKAQSGEFLSAIIKLNQVSTTERNLEAEAIKIITSLESNAEIEFRKELDLYLQKSNFIGAVSVIDYYNTAFPDSDKYAGLRDSYAAKASAQVEAKRKASLAKLSKRYDAFQEITWYKSPSSTNYRNANAFYLYFGVSDGTPAGLRLVIQYYADDWLFINSAKVNVDGTIFDVGGSNWERDNDSEIWEWTDEPLSDRSLIEAIIKSRSSVIRFEGSQYYDTKTISSSQKKALRDVLEAFDSF
jgi:hypothetical protein